MLSRGFRTATARCFSTNQAKLIDRNNVSVLSQLKVFEDFEYDPVALPRPGLEIMNERPFKVGDEVRKINEGMVSSLREVCHSDKSPFSMIERDLDYIRHITFDQIVSPFFIDSWKLTILQ